MKKARNQDQKIRHSRVAWKWYRGFKGAPAGSSLRYSSCRMKYNTIHTPSLQMWNWQMLRADYGWWPESMPVILRNNCIYIQCDGLFLSHSQPLVTPGAHSPSSSLIMISLALHLLHDSSEVISSANREVLSDSWFILVRKGNLTITFSFFLFFETWVIGHWKGNWFFLCQGSKPGPVSCAGWME